MYVVGNSPDDNRLAIQGLGDASKIFMNLRPKIGISKKWMPVLCRKDEV